MQIDSITIEELGTYMRHRETSDPDEHKLTFCFFVILKDILDQMPNYVPISSQHAWNIEEMLEEIWTRCVSLHPWAVQLVFLTVSSNFYLSIQCLIYAIPVYR